MGTINQHRPVLLLNAVISRHDEAFDWTEKKMESHWGPIKLRSERFDFSETSFYEKSMGDKLKKQFYVFENLIDPSSLPDRKHETNAWEVDFAQEVQCKESRPLNLDPGYLSEAKLVLATTKDRDHRLYMRDGIYAEVTLHFHKQHWCKREWTYPDYQREDFQDFFTECRNYLRSYYQQNLR